MTNNCQLLMRQKHGANCE